MTSSILPQPPATITVRSVTLAALARGVAGLLDDAAAAGLPAPSSCRISAFGYPAAELNLYAEEPGVWDALAQWADQYHTQLVTRPAYTANSTWAAAEFEHDGIRYEVSALITSPEPPGDEEEDGDGEDEGDRS